MRQKNYGNKFDIVINTVPALVIDNKKIDSFNEDVLIIELASNPGGIDREYAISKKLKVIVALGIPGKEMPKAAGKYIKETIDKILN